MLAYDPTHAMRNTWYSEGACLLCEMWCAETDLIARGIKPAC